MEAFPGDKDENTEDIPGRRKSRMKSLRTRLFGKNQRSGEAGGSKLSQSAGDITTGEDLGSDDDLSCPQAMIGSRALSHDSIFLDDQVETDDQPARVLSQENVHSKIKALQIKLQQQKMHLGPPPMVLPVRHQEDPGSQSEDSKPHSPPEMLGGEPTSQGGLFKMIPQSAPCPLSPTLKPATTKPLSPTPSHSVPVSVSSNPPPPPPPSSVEAPLDFSTPAQFTSCLDSSAARHRMSVKPRNQRASRKKKLTVVQVSSESESINNTDHFESVEEGEQQLDAQEEVTVERDHGVADISTSQHLPSKSAEVAVVTSEAATKPSHLPQQDYIPPRTVSSVTSQVLRVKPHRHADVTSGERPHSYAECEVEGKKGGQFEIREKRNTVSKPGLTETSTNQLPSATLTFKSSSVHQQVQAEDQTSRGISRPAPGSGSFHFSITTAKNRDRERPRSGSFVGVLEQIESRQKAAKENEEKATREKEESKGFQPRGGPFPVGRLKPDVVKPKNSVHPWDKRDSLKKVAARNAETGSAEGEEAKMSQEVVEVAEEAKEIQEDEGRIAFGVKLRSTSQSMRQRSDSCSKNPSKVTLPEDQCDAQKRQDTSTSVTEKIPTKTPCSTSMSPELRPTDPDPPGLFRPVKHHTPFIGNPPNTSAEVQPPTEATPKEPEPQAAPQTSSSEVSWMSLAMEKTRSLQQLFTSRFPRDLTGMQPAGRPQAPVQPSNLTETVSVSQTQSGKIQQSATQTQAASQAAVDTVKAETAQSRSQNHAVKPSAGGQQKTIVASSDQSHPTRELQMSKQTSDDQPPLNSTHPVSQPQSASYPAVQTNPWTSQCALRSSSQAEAAAHASRGSNTQSLAQSYLSSGQQQPLWSNRGLHPVNQLKSTAAAASASGSPASTASVSTTEKVEREAAVQKESPSLSTGRTVWTGSVSDRAAFLERRAEWKAPPGPNGVELRKAQTEVQTPAEPPKVTPPSKDTVPEGRQGVKLRESSPTKVPEKLREDKWLRKSVAQTSSPSSSPTMPSVLQTMSDSGQPSWMELAKRKSMAWSDKTMD